MKDLQCSFFFLPKSNEENRIFIKMNEGKYEGIVVEISRFNFEECLPILNFCYEILYVPEGKTNPTKKVFDKAIKIIVKKIITSSVNAVRDNENRTTNSQKTNKR